MEKMSQIHYCLLIYQGKVCVRSNKINENVSIQRCQGCRWLRGLKEVKNVFVKPGRTTEPVIWN